MTKLKTFAVSFLLTVGVLLAFIYAHRPKPVNVAAFPELKQITAELFVTSQLRPENLDALKNRGVRSVVDLRPDGEDPAQAPSAEIARAAHESGLDFHYIPIPHEGIPDHAVTDLRDALAPKTSTVLYCRTGRRAVRTYALVEASRVEGPNVDAILETVSKAGFSADDLKDELARRVAQRSSESPTPKN